MTKSISRRQFIGSAAGAAAAPLAMNLGNLSAAPLVADPDFSFDPRKPDSPVRVGIIGVGGRGSSLLGEVLKTKQAEVVAICDIRPDQVSKAQARCRPMQPKGHEDYRDLLAQENLDAIVLATPVYLHMEMALDILASGRHLYCEKPLGLDASQAERVYQAAKRSEKVFQVGFQWHYNANFKAAVDAVHEGLIGDVRFIHAQRHTSGDLPRGWEGWYMDRERSGDIIVEQAIHEMNVFCWAMKAHPIKAWGSGGINYYVENPPGRTVMDHYSLTLEFPNDCRLSYSHMFYATPPLARSHIHIFGTKGAVDVMGGKIYLRDESATPPAREMKLTSADTYNALYSFLDKVVNGGQVDAGPQGALWATKTSVLGRTAIYKETPVRWEDIV